LRLRSSANAKNLLNLPAFRRKRRACVKSRRPSAKLKSVSSTNAAFVRLSSNKSRCWLKGGRRRSVNAKRLSRPSSDRSRCASKKRKTT
jgi:hypothetical protein